MHAETRHNRVGAVADVRMVTERFAFMHLADVHFDDWAFECVQGVQNSDGIVGKGRRVDDDGGGF